MSSHPEAAVKDPERGKPSTYSVTVNETHTVVLEEHRMSAAAIKAAAITQGVPIEQTFVLSVVLPNERQKILADDDLVTLKDGMQFWAIPGDDNS